MAKYDRRCPRCGHATRELSVTGNPGRCSVCDYGKAAGGRRPTPGQVAAKIRAKGMEQLELGASPGAQP